MKTVLFFSIGFILFSTGCSNNTTEELTHFQASHSAFLYQGRTEILENNTTALISSAASVSINFSGNQCEVYLKSEYEPYNYATIVLDGEYLGNIKIKNDSLKAYTIKVSASKNSHTLRIFKTTEATSGALLFGGVKVKKTTAFKPSTEKFIEFIGDSITCGAASDSNQYPCESKHYIDQHNSYLAYGPRVARALNTDFMLSSVSGIGMYRNWNDENIEEPIIAQVYENLYLNSDASKTYDFSRKPAIVSICLGTNDLSKGDGTKPRLAFNKNKFTTNYIQFIKTVSNYYPDSKIVLLNSPMIGGSENELLLSCLTSVQSYFRENHNKTISIFEFNSTYNNGCNGHPSTDEHQEIAAQLTSTFRNLLN